MREGLGMWKNLAKIFSRARSLYPPACGRESDFNSLAGSASGEKVGNREASVSGYPRYPSPSASRPPLPHFVRGEDSGEPKAYAITLPQGLSAVRQNTLSIGKPSAIEPA